MNIHYGKIGDVWKHLPLAQILSIEKPKYYWDSHSGSAVYTLTHSWERDYGVYYFLENAGQSLSLCSSRYYNLLNDLRQNDDTLPIYPGSPGIAILLLGREANYLFCDTDGQSLDNIREFVVSQNVPDSKVKCVQNDGVLSIQNEFSQLSLSSATDLFIHIDPYDPFKKSPVGISALDLFCNFTLLGAKTMLWYGFHSSDSQALARELFKGSFNAYHIESLTPQLWCGEIVLREIDNPDFTICPGINGCGIICGNLSGKSKKMCTELGHELQKIYQNACLPKSFSGALDFITVTL